MQLSRTLVAFRRPRGTELVSALFDVLLAVVGQRPCLLALGLDSLDTAFVFELRKRRVHRAGARTPDAAAALLQLLHQLVAVERSVGEQQQRRRPDRASSCSRPAATAAMWRPRSVTAWTAMTTRVVTVVSWPATSYAKFIPL